MITGGNFSFIVDNDTTMFNIYPYKIKFEPKSPHKQMTVIKKKMEKKIIDQWPYRNWTQDLQDTRPMAMR